MFSFEGALCAGGESCVKCRSPQDSITQTCISEINLMQCGSVSGQVKTHEREQESLTKIVGPRSCLRSPLLTFTTSIPTSQSTLASSVSEVKTISQTCFFVPRRYKLVHLVPFSTWAFYNFCTIGKSGTLSQALAGSRFSILGFSGTGFCKIPGFFGTGLA